MSDKYKIPTNDKEICEIICDKVVNPFKNRGLKMYFIGGYGTLVDHRFAYMHHLYTYDDYNNSANALQDLFEDLLDKLAKDYGSKIAIDWCDCLIHNLQKYRDEKIVKEGQE